MLREIELDDITTPEEALTTGAGVLGIRETLPEGYTNYGLGAVHPNGTVYRAVGYNPSGRPRQVLIRERSVAGTYRTLKTYTQGIDFPTVAGVCQVLPLPNGSLLVSIPIERGGQVRDAEEELPNMCAPFSEGAHNIYSYTAGIEDRIARQQAEAAVQRAGQAERTAQAARDDYTKATDRALQKYNEAVKKATAALDRASVNAAQVIDILNNQLHDQSKLAAFIWQKGKDAAYGLLRDAGYVK